MLRRDFLWAPLLALPSFSALAQATNRTYRIGSIHSAPATALHHKAFFEELERAGFLLGKNLEQDAAGYGLRQEQFGDKTAAGLAQTHELAGSADYDSASADAVRSSADYFCPRTLRICTCG